MNLILSIFGLYAGIALFLATCVVTYRYLYWRTWDAERREQRLARRGL